MQRMILVASFLGFSLGLGCSTGGTTQCLQTAVSSKAPPEGVKACEEALQADWDRQDVYVNLMGLLRAQGRYEEMASWSRRVLEKNDKRQDALFNLAFALRKSGQCSEALKKYQAYAEANRGDPDPFFGMGLCYEDLNDRQNALVAYEMYVQRERRSSQAQWVEKARVKIASLGGALPKAPAAPVVAAPSSPTVTGSPANPKDAALGANVANAAMTPPASPGPSASPAPVSTPSAAAISVAKPKPAPAPVAKPASSADCTVHQNAFQKDPFNTAAYDRYAECAIPAGKNEDVIRFMRLALRDNPDFARGWLHLGRAFRAKGDAIQARSSLGKACALGIAEACSQ